MNQKKDIELYIHIPFCIRKCHYCDFLSFSSTPDQRAAYLDALCEEIRICASYVRGKYGKVRSIFLGGGTPSILDSVQTERILDGIYDSFSVKKKAEISIEANPGTLSEEKLAAYCQMGINRLSIGLQSTEDACLKRLGRIHSYREFLDNYRQARRVGFTNINVDLMSALPGQTLSSYMQSLETVLALEPEHISAYSLILEEGTPFYDDKSLRKELPDEDTERQMYEMTRSMLEQRGYRRYEISNYARPGRECIHNTGYWDNIPYLGLGLGAASYWTCEPDRPAMRFSNSRSMLQYGRKPFLPFEEREEYQILSTEEEMEEYMYLGLRKMDGVSVEGFKERFRRDMRAVYGTVIDRYLAMHLLDLTEGRLKLTEEGINVSNRIFADFLLDED